MIGDNESNLCVYYQNVRGLRTKTETFLRSVLLNDYDVIALTETWLLDSISDNELLDDRYLVWRRDRNYISTGQTMGGGVLLAVKRELCSYMNVAWQSSAEDIWVSIRLGCNNKPKITLHLCVLYLCDENNGNCFKTQLVNFSNNLINIITDNNSDTLIILGDFNMSCVQWLPTNGQLQAVNIVNPLASDFIDTLNVCGLQQFNSTVNNFGRILDLVLCNVNIVTTACPDPLVPEDPHHRALITLVPISNYSPLKVLPRTSHNYFKADYDRINESLHKIDWISALSGGSVNNAVESFYEIISNIRDSFVPVRKAYKSKYPPWFSYSLIKVIKEKFKYFKKFKTYGNVSDKQSYSILRDRVSRMERTCYVKYISNIEDSIAKNPKAFWSFVKSKRNSAGFPSTMNYNGNSSDSGQTICEFFSAYFHSTFLIPAASGIAPDANKQIYDTAALLCDIAGVEVDASTVQRLLQNLDLSKSAGPDMIPAIFLVSCAEELSVPVSILFRRSLNEGAVPDLWKLAFISPIHKKGTRGSIEHYRPISKLCLIAKVLERIVYSQLYSALKMSFSPLQHGFLKGRSTVSNLVLFNDYVSQRMDGGDQVDAIYTDYSKAFDRIDHGMLLGKLKGVGVRGSLLEWLSSYVAGRKQAVVLNGYESAWMSIPSGVPQGSQLGPLLFVISIQDIDSCFINSNVLLFADDMKIFRVVNNVSDASLLQQDLLRLDGYCTTNKLDLNVSKCFFLTFTRKLNPYISNYSIKYLPLTRVYESKDLGVIHDSGLVFEKHIGSVVGKASKALGFVMRSSKSFRKMKTVKILYCAYVRSHLEYASQIWNPCYDIYRGRLERVQRKFIRYLGFKFKMPKLKYHNQCAKLHLLPLNLRRDIADLTFLMKVARGIIDCPELLCKLKIKVPTHSVRRRPLLQTPLAHSNYRQNSFINRACALFNRLFSSNSDGDNDVDIFCSSFFSLRKAIIKNFLALLNTEDGIVEEEYCDGDGMSE